MPVPGPHIPVGHRHLAAEPALSPAQWPHARRHRHHPGRRPLGAIVQSGDWVVVRCKAGDKAIVIERLLAAGIHVSDFRVEDAPEETAAAFGDLAIEGDLR